MKRRVLSFTLALFFVFAYFLNSIPIAKALSVTAEVIVPPKYDFVRYFHEGMAAVNVGGGIGIQRTLRGGKWGFIDNTGKEVVPPIYGWVGDFQEGLAIVTVEEFPNGKYGFINKQGEVVIPLIYAAAESFQEGIACVAIGESSERKYGYIDKTGREIIPLKYSLATSFVDGFAKVEILDWVTDSSFTYKRGMIDKTGREVIQTKYAYVDYFSEGYAVVATGNASFSETYRYGFVDSSGRETVPAIYDSAHSFSEGLAAVMLGNDEWGYIDTHGNVAIPIKYLTAGDFSEGLACVSTGRGLDDARFGYIDKSGREIVPLKYSRAEPFSEGLAIVVIDGDWRTGKYGVIDITGKEIVPPVYDRIYPFREGLAMVALNNKVGVIDTSGNEIVPLIYDWTEYRYKNNSLDYHCYSDGVALVSLNGKWGAIDNTGREVVTPKYDDVLSGFCNGVAAIKINGKWGTIDSSGREVVTPLYDAIWGEVYTEGAGDSLRFLYENIITVSNGKYMVDVYDCGFIKLTEAANVAPSLDAVDELEGADSWAYKELRLALEAELILDDMVGNWTQPTSRLLAAEAIVKLIEVSTGKTIDVLAVENGFDMGRPFADTNNKAVTFLKAAGISNGVDGVNYGTSGVYTRIQMVTMLGRMAENIFGIDLSVYPPGSDTFTDLPDWPGIDSFVGWAVAAEVTNGIGGGLFNSNGTLQNQHTGVFAYRAFETFI